MKKLLSLCLTVVMMVCLLAGVSVNAAGAAAGGASGGTGATPVTPAYEYYTFRRENFGIMGNTTYWGPQNIGNNEKAAGCFPMNQSSDTDNVDGCLVRSRGYANQTITSEFYVDTAGTYSAYMFVEQSGHGFKLAIDEQETTTTIFGSTVNQRPSDADRYAAAPNFYNMEKAAETWELGVGWHTVKVTTVGTYGKFATVFITNDASLAINNITYVKGNSNAVVDNKVNMAAYEDFTAPVISSFVATADANTANEHRTSVTLTWAATDARGITKYELHNGTEWVDVTNEASYTIDNLWASTNYTFKLRVTDGFGYKAETSTDVTTNGPSDDDGPQWPAEAAITATNISFGSTITWPVATDNREVAGYEIYEDAVDASNLIASVDAATNSYTLSLIPGEPKDIVLVAKDLIGQLSAELTATVASTAGADGYTLRLENFDMPDAALKLWVPQNISSTMKDAGCLGLNSYPSTLSSSGQALYVRTTGAEVSAEVWVDAPGEYALFAQMESGSMIKAALNGQKTTGYLSPVAKPTATGALAYTWVKADRVWTLESGWNTLTLSSDADTGYIAALFLTNSVDIDPTELTYVSADNTLIIDSKLNTALREDTEGPEFEEGNITVTYDSTDNEATITWPAATDRNVSLGSFEAEASGLKAYRIYVNGKKVGEVDRFTTTFTIDSAVLVPGETIAIKVEALDGYGNEKAKTIDYEVSKLVISSFNIKNSTGVASSLADFDGTVQAELVIKNVSAEPTDAVDIRLAIAIYDATGDLLYGDEIDRSIAADGVDATVTATITGAPTDLTGCTVKAHLWNASDLSPASTKWTTKVIQ